MKLGKRNSDLIKNWLTKRDITEIAGILGYSRPYVYKILHNEREVNTPASQEILRVAIRRARQNKYFRTNSNKVA